MTRAGRGRVVVAPDAFRGTLDAAAAAEAMAAGARDAWPDAEIVVLPLADGGEGSLDCVLRAGWSPVDVTAHGPLGEPVAGRIAREPGTDRALVELAELCGWSRTVDRPRPLEASSHGAGDGIRAALDAGARRIVLAVGGSVSTDGGTGLLTALGGRARDAAGAVLPAGGGALVTLDRLDLTGLDPRMRDTELVLATDVDNPLVGPRGAAAVFGPQKGADAAQVLLLDDGLRRLADVLLAATGLAVHDLPGAGAAGGVGAIAVAVLGARVASAAELLFDLVGLDERLAGADLVLTGEGRLDATSFGGKLVGRLVARIAGRAGGSAATPVGVVAGQVAPDLVLPTGLTAVRALTAADATRATADTAPLLREVTAALVRDLG